MTTNRKAINDDGPLTGGGLGKPQSAVQQPELPLAAKPDANTALADFIAILESQADWITASKLLVLAGWPVTDSNKRTLRDLASQSDGQIISGQRGYRHIRHATAEEINHAANWLQHQAVEMDARARAIRQRYHTLLTSKK